MSERQPVEQPAIAARRSNRRQLLLIAVITAVSLGGSYWLYFNTLGSGVWGTTNNGAFVDPPVQAAQLSLQADNLPYVHGETWWVWLVGNSACVGDCQDTLTKLRNMHVLLNKDADRLRRALIRLDVTEAGQQDAALLNQFPQLRQLHLSPASTAPSDPVLQQGIYIVDPLGNLVFFYRLEQMGKPVLEDLKRLLKVSQIG